MLKKIILSVLMASAVLSGTVFAGLVTPSVPTPPTPQALKNGSSSGSSGGSGTTICSYIRGFTAGEYFTLTTTNGKTLKNNCSSVVTLNVIQPVIGSSYFNVYPTGAGPIGGGSVKL